MQGSDMSGAVHGSAGDVDALTIKIPPLPIDLSVNPIADRKDWQNMRQACIKDPGKFHGDIAATTIHWFHPEKKAWLSKNKIGRWQGWSMADGSPVTIEDWQPWNTAFDKSSAPYYRWCRGGLTNAAFNEVDRHVVAGQGNEIAFFFEGDRWDPHRQGGWGAPVREAKLTRRELLLKSVVAAIALKKLGVQKGDRIALYLPNCLDQIIWTEAAKRLGVIYTPVFGGFSEKTLADRLQDAGVKVLITADGGSRNAENVLYKERFTDPAVADYVPVEKACEKVREILPRYIEKQGSSLADSMISRLRGEMTVAPRDIMSLLGEHLAQVKSLDIKVSIALRSELAQALHTLSGPVEKVIVVPHIQLRDVPMTPGRDVWANDILAHAEREVCYALHVESLAETSSIAGHDLVAKLWQVCPCEPVDANHPMFIMYTSGSTGKPKGIVHVHGGYVAGIAHTMKVAFDAKPGRDVIYVIADPGWITGQSYLISAALTNRIPSVVAECSPLFPNAGRFASIIQRYRVTILKAGVTFLKSVMADAENLKDVERYDLSSLRVATFCAEPTSPAVQLFGMEHITPYYTNSYWATEHGGIAWTHPYGNADLRLKSDAHSFPLPWVMGDVWLAQGDTDNNGRRQYRVAAPGECGELVLTMPYPYQGRTLWGDAENVNKPEWEGDLNRFKLTYYSRFKDEANVPVLAYVQGDLACKYDDLSFSFHGRSDDVINVSGHRIGTEEIEGAILRDKILRTHSPLGNCLVIGAPDAEKGQVPLAFVTRSGNQSLTEADRNRLRALVREDKGSIAEPVDFIELDEFPETRSGKYMRRVLKALLDNKAVGDLSTLRNPESVELAAGKIKEWERFHLVRQDHSVVEKNVYVTINYFPVTADKFGDPIFLAMVTIRNGALNVLCEKLLDELSRALEHLERREDVGGIVIRGHGNQAFVAGADVNELIEMSGRDAVKALASKAQMLFSRIEAMEKPVVAAAVGLTLGGGNELLMACHYRVGCPRTRIAQPEINLFIPPGFGGTQRLPRLLIHALGNFDDALNYALVILLSGRQIKAEEAMYLGLLNEVTQGIDPVGRACELVRQAIVEGVGPVLDAFHEREYLLTEWARPVPVPLSGVIENREVQRLLRHAVSVDRGKVANVIVKLVQMGLEQGIAVGLRAELEAFSAAVIDDENGGKKGIELFLTRKSPSLPTRPRPRFGENRLEELIREARLLPVGSPFYPGVSKLPQWQFAFGVQKDEESGEPMHGEPRRIESEFVIPVPSPSAHQALIYVLGSEINFNDVWALTGVPVSVFDFHDEDQHVTGSGGIGIVVKLGDLLQTEGRLQLGDVVAIYSGVSDLMDPSGGFDPMSTDFRNQGYETPNGTHQQFAVVDGPQCVRLPSNATFEQAGSYVLAAGTVYRALFHALEVKPGKRLLVEGASSGTGAWAVNLARHHNMKVTGIVSSKERKAQVEQCGATSINRKDLSIKDCFEAVPRDESQWKWWNQRGEPFLEKVRDENDGNLVDYAISHSGQDMFARTFQALAPGGTLAFYGASTGHHLNFLGKTGAQRIHDLLVRANVFPGENVLLHYGISHQEEDEKALEAIEALRSACANIFVLTQTQQQADFLYSLGFGEAISFIFSIEQVKREHPEFVWPDGFPELPDPVINAEKFKDVVRQYSENSFKPLVKSLVKSKNGQSGPVLFDVVVERADRDTLSLSTMLTKSLTGRVIYFENMGGRRYSFYAPHVWMRQRRILMPMGNIVGTHLCNAAEVLSLNEYIDKNRIVFPHVALCDWKRAPEIHQAMWENRLPEALGGATKALLNHALPDAGVRSIEELYVLWAGREKNR